MTSNTTGDPPDTMERLALRMARLAARIEEVRAAMDLELAGLLDESERLLADIRALNPADIEADRGDPGAVLATQIPDERLRRVWQALFRYSDGGATADEIAGDLERHRTTVSTYLNMLVVMGHAGKRRSGHSIYYTAIVKPEHAKS